LVVLRFWLYCELIDLRRQYEVRFGEPVHGMRPGRDLDLAPSQKDVGVMALLFSQCAYSIHECKRRFKIRKLVAAHEVMLVDDIPLGLLGPCLAVSVFLRTASRT